MVGDRAAVREIFKVPEGADVVAETDKIVMELELDDGLCGQAVAHGIAARMLFPQFGFWSGALEGVATISFKLPKRGHGLCPLRLALL
jgi:hypothetical protein